MSETVSFIIFPATDAVLTDFGVDGILWFTDLAVPDPYHVLPILTGLGFFTLNQVLLFLLSI